MKVELNIRVVQTVSGDLSDTPQSIPQRVPVNAESPGRVRVIAARSEVTAEGRNQVRVPALVVIDESSEPLPHKSLDGTGVLRLREDLEHTEVVKRDDGRLKVAK